MRWDGIVTKDNGDEKWSVEELGNMLSRRVFQGSERSRREEREYTTVIMGHSGRYEREMD